MRYVVKRSQSKASRLLQRWKDQEHWYVARVDDATFAQKIGSISRRRTSASRNAHS